MCEIIGRFWHITLCQYIPSTITTTDNANATPIYLILIHGFRIDGKSVVEDEREREREHNTKTIIEAH